MFFSKPVEFNKASIPWSIHFFLETSEKQNNLAAKESKWKRIICRNQAMRHCNSRYASWVHSLPKRFEIVYVKDFCKHSLFKYDFWGTAGITQREQEDASRRRRNPIFHILRSNRPYYIQRKLGRKIISFQQCCMRWRCRINYSETPV